MIQRMIGMLLQSIMAFQAVFSLFDEWMQYKMEILVWKIID